MLKFLAFFFFFPLVAHHYSCLVVTENAAGKASRSSVMSFLVRPHALPAEDQLDHVRDTALWK